MFTWFGKSDRPVAMIRSGRVLTATAYRISGSELARAKTIGFSAIARSIAGVTQFPTDRPKKTSAPRKASARLRISVWTANRALWKIPVFYDDQHGTAIISGAALLNALELAGKKIDQVRVVFNGAGAAAVACAEHYIRLGVRRENVIMCDTKGVVFKGRTEGMNR